MNYFIFGVDADRQEVVVVDVVVVVAVVVVVDVVGVVGVVGVMGASWVHYLPCLAYSALLAFFMYITLIVPPGVKIGKRENYSLNRGTL